MPEQAGPDRREPRTVNPYTIINRGEDSLSSTDEVVFTDFSAKIYPAHAEVDLTVGGSDDPKALSAPASVVTSESLKATAQTVSGQNVQTDPEMAQVAAKATSKALDPS